MVNSSTNTNMNKKDNYLSRQLTEHKNRPRHMTLEIKILAKDRYKHLAGLNQLMGSQPSSFDNWIHKAIHM